MLNFAALKHRTVGRTSEVCHTKAGYFYSLLDAAKYLQRYTAATPVVLLNGAPTALQVCLSDGTEQPFSVLHNAKKPLKQMATKLYSAGDDIAMQLTNTFDTVEGFTAELRKGLGNFQSLINFAYAHSQEGKQLDLDELVVHGGSFSELISFKAYMEELIEGLERNKEAHLCCA